MNTDLSWVAKQTNVVEARIKRLKEIHKTAKCLTLIEIYFGVKLNFMEAKNIIWNPGEALGAVNTWEMTFYIPVGLPGKSDTGRRGFLTIKFVSLHQYAFQVKASKVRFPWSNIIFMHKHL